MSCFLIIARNIIRTRVGHGPHIFGREFRCLFREQHYTGFRLPHNGAGNSHIRHILADGRQTVTALIRKKIPDNIAPGIQMFMKTDNLKIPGVQIGRILMRAALFGAVGGQIMPFLTGYLAAATCRASRSINQKCLRHCNAP